MVARTKRLFNRANGRQVGHIGGIAQRDLFTVGHVEIIGNRGRGGDQIEVKLPSQTFLNNFHMQQAEETATETKADGCRIFVLVFDAGVVELEFGQGVF